MPASNGRLSTAFGRFWPRLSPTNHENDRYPCTSCFLDPPPPPVAPLLHLPPTRRYQTGEARFLLQSIFVEPWAELFILRGNLGPNVVVVSTSQRRVIGIHYFSTHTQPMDPAGTRKSTFSCVFPASFVGHPHSHCLSLGNHDQTLGSNIYGTHNVCNDRN